jgi:hypothetical protein
MSWGTAQPVTYKFLGPHALRNCKALADRERASLVDGIPAGAPFRRLLFIQAFGHAGCDSPDTGLITTPASIWPVLSSKRHEICACNSAAFFT